ncbi:oligogalacturonate-specific porin KdgM family protein [Vibrio tapetis subsp. quintayensis]|uniref:oligogalacturonate-specific porin KdgM family protein n=1 Tax=Vibrio tapetis TaxID=52443 RepID=UPI0025B3CAAB|nr:oligogalacturonate-specific porin KdgM family protein [Vibrio tapetis]MDN3681749.1 oligogalacturonate-specific porin KdgM family protein [Vibrio tapetis subsp. quintayensis]
MKNINKITIALTTTLLACSVSAASIDYRHEYKHEQKRHADRIKIGGSSNDFYFGVEMKFNGAQNDDGSQDLYKNLQRGDSEFDFGYKHKIDDKWFVQPGMPITFSSEKVTFKPQVRVGYKFDSGVQAKLRYRHEFQQYTEQSGDDNRQKSKITGNLDYSYEQFQFGFEGNYEIAQTDGYKLFNDGDTNYELNFKVGYKIPDTAWRPYVEVGNASVSSSTDQRQMRTRVGMTYSF